jgi:hypothetical protein
LHIFLNCAAEEMSLIEEISQKSDGTRCRISPEELAAYFEATVDLHMYLQGTIMGLNKLNALVRREQRGWNNARHALEEAMGIALVRSCNKCKTKLKKESGCNKMTCCKCHKTQY